MNGWKDEADKKWPNPVHSELVGAYRDPIMQKPSKCRPCNTLKRKKNKGQYQPPKKTFFYFFLCLGVGFQNAIVVLQL